MTALEAPYLLNASPLAPEKIAPFGWMLGKPIPHAADAIAFTNSATDFWQEHVFDPGKGGETEILWVNYRNNDVQIDALEQHLVTQQAVVPLTGNIVQILALPNANGRPDPKSIRAFYVNPGQGICMKPGVWHATRSAGATCMMLTRRSTTADLVNHLVLNGEAVETSFCKAYTFRLANKV